MVRLRQRNLPREEVALELIAFLLKRYPALIRQRYRLASQELEALECFEQIAQKRGCLQKGGVIDWEKAADSYCKIFVQAELEEFHWKNLAIGRMKRIVDQVDHRRN